MTKSKNIPGSWKAGRQPLEPAQPKWQGFDKVTTLLTTEQKEGLDRVAKKIMKHRSKELEGNDNKERITANTVIRALVENFLEYEESLQMKTLSSEQDVHEWVEELFNQDFRRSFRGRGWIK